MSVKDNIQQFFITSDDIDIPKMMLRCKAEYEVNFRTHTGTRTLAYSSFKGDYILRTTSATCQTSNFA